MRTASLLPLKSSLPLLLVFTLFGCIESPLLNHADAQVSVSGPQQNLTCTDLELPAAENSTSACPIAFPNAGLCASFTWEKKQADEEKGSFILRFWDAATGNESGPYLDPQVTIEVKPMMRAHGHGTPFKVKVASALDCEQKPLPGVYRASNVYLTMPGEWEIETRLIRENTEIDLAIFKVIQD